MKTLREKLLAFIKNAKKVKSTKRAERLAVVICVPILIGALAVCFSLFSGRGKSKKPSENFTEELTYDPYSSYSATSEKPVFEFQSLGDGSCLVSGIGSISASEISIPERSPSGEKVIGIGSRAFDGCARLVSINIHENIVTIGSGAFRNCPSLVMISVDPDNEKYSAAGGTLFSKDKTRLLCCPAARIGNNYMLNPNVRIIEDYAFDGIINITRILYEKSTADFENIIIGIGNDRFRSLPITCNYLPSK